MCFTHGKYRGSGCKPRGLEDITIRRDVNKPLSHLRDSCLSPKLLSLGIAHASTALHSLNRNSALRLGCQLTPSRCADFPYLANARMGRKRDLAMGVFIDRRTKETKEFHTQRTCSLCSYVLINYPCVYTGGRNGIAMRLR